MESRVVEFVLEFLLLSVPPGSDFDSALAALAVLAVLAALAALAALPVDAPVLWLLPAEPWLDPAPPPPAPSPESESAAAIAPPTLKNSPAASTQTPAVMRKGDVGMVASVQKEPSSTEGLEGDCRIKAAQQYRDDAELWNGSVIEFARCANRTELSSF
ncbi:hypothetical protein [Mycobacterium sp. IS-3022]|uniref:hypothetical protein n=1 Tax=Mycobacterium sp. IS-3022 TaxID=1772277 RepID=UPI0012E3B891|nr:hypothetical protein [Mycobacterium sp. IS-3022]